VIFLKIPAERRGFSKIVPYVYTTNKGYKKIKLYEEIKLTYNIKWLFPAVLFSINLNY